MAEIKSEKNGNVLKYIIGIISFIGMGTIVSIILFLYFGFLKQPKMKCIIKDNEKTFSVKDEFRSISMNLHPQMIIRFDNDNILQIYLEGYYEEENLKFNENKEAKAVQCHVEYVEELQKYMKEKIILEVHSRNSEISKTEINERLHIYVNTLGGVKYESEEGNEEKRYCIEEQDGIVIDYDEHNEEITNRLYEAELLMQDDLASIETDEKINSLIQGITEEIIHITK